MRNKFFAYLIAGIAAVLALGSCSSGVSYAELLRDERKATNKFLAYQHVLNEIPSDTIFETGPNAPYYRLDEDGNVWITGPDFENPDEDCRWIVCSYFPDEGKVYLLNLDYAHERKCVLQQFGDKDFVTLGPGEFRIIESVKLDPGEKLNEM